MFKLALALATAFYVSTSLAQNLQSFGDFLQPVKFKNSQNLNYKLPDFDGQKINYTVTKGTFDLPRYDYRKNEYNIVSKDNYSIERPELYDETGSEHVTYGLTITFNKLTDAQFTFLKNYYKTAQPLSFSKDRKYSISDFLPKAVQSVLNKYYVTNRETVSKDSIFWFYNLSKEDRALMVSSTSNCWNAAWEYLRNSPTEFTTFFAPEEVATKYLTDKKYSTEIAKLNKTQIMDVIYKGSNDTIKPGDLVMIYQKMQSMAQGEFEALSHVAVYLGGGIVFEKTNSSSSSPFKLSLLSSAIENLVVFEKDNPESPTTIKDLKSTRIVVRRFDKARLPPAREALSLLQNDGVFLIKADIPAALKPNDKVYSSYTLVGDIGTGGNILFEYLYKIVDHKF